MPIENFAVYADHLGFIAFAYILVYAILRLKEKKDLRTIILLVISIIGITVDGAILGIYYLR